MHKNANKFFCFGVVVTFCFWAILFIRYQQKPLFEGLSSPAESKLIRVDTFLEYYKNMSENENYELVKEYHELFYDENLEERSLNSVLQCNTQKNRYPNVLAYDHSRFKLEVIDGCNCSDYINANYLPGFFSPKEFIATQGPLTSTRNDFWRMVWESNSKAIVMLTKVYENGEEKTNHYWPYDKNRANYGDFGVTILKESVDRDWTITEFLLDKGSDKRVIQHFHFTTWPDHGVPSTPDVLILFVRAFRKRVQGHPIIVHCSAGVGRTGTFITLDRLMHQISRGDNYIDLFGTVQELRNHRFWMVQKPDQYVFLYQCLLKLLSSR